MLTRGMYALLSVYLAVLVVITAPLAVLSQDEGEVSIVPIKEDVSSPQAAYQVTNGDKPADPATRGATDFSLQQNGKPCLRAFLESTFNIQYRTQGPTNTKVLTAEIKLPNPSEKVVGVSGACGESRSNLIIEWEELYSVEMVFERTTSQTASTSSIASWAVTQILFTVDTRNNTKFDAIINASVVVTASTAKSEQHFATPLNFSYNCVSQEDISLNVYKNISIDKSILNEVTMSVWNIRVQAFDLPSSSNFSDAASCKSDLDLALPKQNIVPLIVAACLAALILIIVVAYFFVKNRHQTFYSSME